MRKRQEKPNPSRRKLMRTELVERIAGTVTIIIETGVTEELKARLADLIAEDQLHDGMAYDDAMVIVNRAQGFEQTGSGTYRMLD